MTDTTRYTHDSAFKSVLHDLNAVKEFIDHFLSPELAALIDKDTIKAISDTYFDKSLGQRSSDSLFEATIQNESALLALLFEHKYDTMGIVPLQILKYLTGNWEKNLKNKKPLTHIIPIIVYHGDEKTNYKSLYSYFKYKNPLLKIFVPDFQCIFVNVNRIADEILFDLSDTTALKSLFLIFKHIDNPEFLRQNLDKIVKFALENENLSEQLTQLLLYLLNNSALIFEDIEPILDTLPEVAQKK